MSIVDLLVSTTDPITAVLIVALARYIREQNKKLASRIEDVRNRVRRLEGVHIPDGGDPADPPLDPPEDA